MNAIDHQTSVRPGRQLRSLLAGDGAVRAIGAHDALSARIAALQGFECIWASGLGISSVSALPDIGLISLTETADAVRRMRWTTPTPILVDADSGSEDPQVMRHIVRSLEDAGAAGLCIEDKQHPKRNSFRNGNVLVPQKLFAQRIAVATRGRVDPSFMIVARIESLIAGTGLDDALERATLYAEAGADALLIHSKAADTSEVERFAAEFASTGVDVPLICIPTTYPRTTVELLNRAGYQMIIFANQLLRASVRAMVGAAEHVKQAGSSSALEDDITTLGELFDLLGYDAAEADESLRSTPISG
ncbi:isocitrate lyase/phosphoenolpyruvate mutase family protein [Kribbella sp. NPDC056345]|uniref:isocitrate lyase/phosphoenolpyruvate mutase family protein n=1 Tax=Kribbella sp. NPDC056345 TaxID=3345789 RepID=UPI0035DD4775